jgi:hypothetical protein
MGDPMVTPRITLNAALALCVALLLPGCTAQTGFRTGAELLESAAVCEGPIEPAEGDAWTCPSGRSTALRERAIVACVHDDPAAAREEIGEMLEFSWLLDTVVMGDGWYVYGLSRHQASQVVDAVGGRVISRGRTPAEWPHIARARMGPGTVDAEDRSAGRYPPM